MNHVSSKTVLAKVHRDFRPQVAGWHSSAVEWIGEALEAIGVSSALETKSTANPDCEGAAYVKNHRYRIPCELVDILAIEYKGRKLPLGGDITGHSLSQNKRTTEIYTDASRNSSHDLIAGNSQSIKKLTVEAQPLGESHDYYLLNPNYIQTSFEEGFIKIHYTAYPLDKEGFPLVPNHYKVLTAITWYIVKQLMLLGYKHPEINYKDAEQRWYEYRRLAENHLGFPTIDKMERFKNMWVRIAPETTFPADFFAGVETQENIKFI
jgi:hypothetical protein